MTEPDPIDPDDDVVAPLVVNPDPNRWTLIESMEVRREFGYDSEQWQDALDDSPELALIGSAWLALRKHEPGITWKEAGTRITLGDRMKSIKAQSDAHRAKRKAKENADPKAMTKRRRPARPR